MQMNERKGVSFEIAVLVTAVAITGISLAAPMAQASAIRAPAVITANSTALAGYVDVGNSSELSHHYVPEWVQAGWVLKKVISPKTCLSKKGIASFWTGVGGWNNDSRTFDPDDAVKVGVSINCTKVVEYQEWEDFGPGNEHIVSTQIYSANPSVTVSGEIQFDNLTGEFRTLLQIWLSGNAAPKSYYLNQTDSSVVANSIEWILEESGKALPHFEEGGTSLAEGVWGNATNNTSFNDCYEGTCYSPCFDGFSYSISENIGCILTFENIYKYDMITPSSILIAYPHTIKGDEEEQEMKFNWESYGP